jgi:phosphonopyruvate decarboxylase
MMPRTECLKMLAELRGDAIVIPTYTTMCSWRTISPSPLNYVSLGAMGQASSHALGFALGLPDHKIIVLDGDGSLLMNLPSLVTIANAAPKNLVHFVVENGCYEANGSHPIPGQGRVSFAGFARAAGYPQVFEFDGINRFAAELPHVLAVPGPVFATLKIEADDDPEQDYAFMHSPDRRREFKEALRPILARRKAAAR